SGASGSTTRSLAPSSNRARHRSRARRFGSRSAVIASRTIVSSRRKVPSGHVYDDADFAPTPNRPRILRPSRSTSAGVASGDTPSTQNAFLGVIAPPPIHALSRAPPRPAARDPRARTPFFEARRD